MVNAESKHVSEFVLSDSAKISLLTCSPGNELYSIFGHSAIRVKDPANKLDIVFNYGTFDFSEPNFYPNFVRGHLNYILSGSYFDDFKYSYTEENRSIQEQVLNITAKEKQYLLDSLFINYQPENRYYRYDFFYDNCATRIRNIFVEAIPRKIEFDNSPIVKGKSFRQLLMPYLVYQPWARLGINLLLGIPADRVATPWDYMYLPDYLQEGFKYAYFKSDAGLKPFAQQPKQILGRKVEKAPLIWWTPTLVFLLILVFAIALSYYNFKKGIRRFWFDRILLIVTGLLGVLFAFLWLGTAHRSMAWNLNLLWANPFNLFVGLILTAKKFKRFVQIYIKANLILLAVLLVVWFLLPQTLPIVVYPVVFTIALRMFILFRYQKQ